MTNTVTMLTHSVDRELIKRLFARLKSKYGQLWSSRATSAEEWEFTLQDWLEELREFEFDVVRTAVNDALDKHADYPPTLGQLVNCCLTASGVPDCDKLLAMVIAKDFSHPTVKLMYDKIGSWRIEHNSDQDLRKLAQEHYRTCVVDFKQSQKHHWQQLKLHNEQPKQLPPPPKIPSATERKGFAERMSEYKLRAEELKAASNGITHREFEANKINQHHVDFDQQVFDDYRNYLLSIADKDVMLLPTSYMYQRMRFLNQQEAIENMMHKSTPTPNNWNE